MRKPVTEGQDPSVSTEDRRRKAPSGWLVLTNVVALCFLVAALVIVLRLFL